ncbi:unnamed protein product, partial [Ectocarpus sp. 6 AP-2014]
MTGIADALHNARAAVGLNAVESPEETCRTIPRPCSAWQQRQALVPNVEVRNTFEPGDATATSPWALLLPITSFGIGEQDNAKCMRMLERFKGSLLSTTTADDRSAISICVALDEGDPVYTKGKVVGFFNDCGLARVQVTMVHPGFFGNVCTIWNLLAAKAVEDCKADYLVLVGDDVELETPGWKGEIEASMRNVSEAAGLPLGMACVAFRDLTMPAFPSFPVIHRRHVEVFGAVLPPEFVNQGGDPFLFELYRRFGASAFADTASLKNLVGGKEEARYPKVGVRWQGAILTREIERFSRLVRPTGPRFRCLGVVVPTFRIAKVVAYPPWGVTANLCVSGRSGDIWFSPAYPKTGGGEDVDFCLKTRQKYGRDAIVAVPGAAATHPYWANPIRQVWGWARGDALCLSFHPHSTFYRAPDWAETIVFIWLVFGVANIWSVTQCLTASGVVGTVEFLEGLAHVYPGTTGAEPWSAVLLAPIPSMVQDVARLVTKLAQGNLYQLLLSFDWMDGTDGHKWRTASRVLHAAKLSANLLIGVSAALGYGLHCSLVVVAGLLMSFRWQTPGARRKATNQRAPARFVVLAWQRTGSNLLCGLLHNHSGVFMHNEIFHNRTIHTYHQDRLEKWGWTVAHRDADPRRFISEVWARSDRPEQAIGFKLFPEHIYRNPETMASLLADATVKKIVLRRGNAVAAYVSQRRVLLTGQFLQVQQPGNVSIRIDPDELQDHLANYESCYATYSRLLAGQAFHEKGYSPAQLILLQQPVRQNAKRRCRSIWSSSRTRKREENRKTRLQWQG